MEPQQIQALTATFEDHAQQAENGVDYWLGRDLQHLLGYAEWRNFLQVVTKAKTACELSGQSIADHFVEVNKMVIQKNSKLPLRKLILPCRPVRRN